MTTPVPPYGWKPQPPDHRDFKLTPASAPGPSSDNSNLLPGVLDQGNLGSCTGAALALLAWADRVRDGQQKPFTPSIRWIYYWERWLEGTVDQDAGANLRDGCKVLTNMGVCSQDPPAQKGRWLYDIPNFAVAPTPDTVFAASHHRAAGYMAVTQDLDHMRAYLSQGGLFCIGISCYDSFEDPATMDSGDVPMPSGFEGYLGGHAIVVYGHDDSTRRFKWQNSWGVGYGHSGRGTIPYDYLATPGLAADLWAVPKFLG